MDPLQVFEAGLLSRYKTIHAATEPGDSEVQQFYDGCTIFITGGSGFLGKQLIEKLFRATNVRKIFMLIRHKKGKQIKDRLCEILKDPVFDLVRSQKPNFEQKLVPIAGDVAELRLGLTDEDWNAVTAEADIIFHGAATTRFDEVLRVSTLINVRGTREVLVLGTECKKLKSFVHVSTVYAHATINLVNMQILEKFYQSPVDPEAMIKLVESIEDSRLNDITPNLIKGWPNTYTFTKAVTEELVRTMGRGLPLCIVRPAIVIATRREPNPGWLDISCVYGASGLILGGGLGAIHALYLNYRANVTLVPVDYVNNSAIVAAWETANKRDEEIKIYNVVPSKQAELTYAQYSIPSSIGYVFLLPTSNSILFFAYTLFTHTIPSYIIDAFLIILGRKIMAVKIYNKIYRMSKALSFFALNQWHIDDNNLLELYEKLSPKDKEIFDFDMTKINWLEYMTTWGLGLRKYIIKDGLTGTNYGRKKQSAFRLLMLFIVPLYFYMLYKVVYLGIAGVSFIF